MIIVYVHHSYWPVLGGCELAMQRLCEHLVSLGHEVFVVTSRYNADDRPRYEVINGIDIIRVKAYSLHFPDLTVPKEVPRKILEKADIIQGWSQNSYFTYRVCREAKKLGKHIIMYFLGVDYLKNHSSLLIRLFGYPYQKWVTRKVAKITDLALVTNEHEKKLLKKRYGLEAVVLPHGVEDRFLTMPNMAKYFRNKYGINERIITYIGRIHPTKGLDLLIRAFTKVTEKEPDVALVVAGKGETNYFKKCIKLIKSLGLNSKVRYFGYISEEDKIGLIDSSEFVVIPSRHAGESYPLVIDEVKARGKPLIVTNYGALPYRIINLVEGVVVDADICSLARGLCYALSNRCLFHVVSKPLTWKEVADKLLTLYQSIVG